MKYYSVKETAKICNVHERTVRRWVSLGKIDYKKSLINSKIFIPETEIPSYFRMAEKGGSHDLR